MINLEPRHLALLKTILSRYDYSFYLFGSRITDKTQQFSDIDLFFFESIPSVLLDELAERLVNSDLPFKVDLVDFNTCTESFQAILLQSYVCIQSSTVLKNIQLWYGNYLHPLLASGSDGNCKQLVMPTYAFRYVQSNSDVTFLNSKSDVTKLFSGSSITVLVAPDVYNFENKRALLAAGFVEKKIFVLDLAIQTTHSDGSNKYELLTVDRKTFRCHIQQCVKNIQDAPCFYIQSLGLKSNGKHVIVKHADKMIAFFDLISHENTLMLCNLLLCENSEKELMDNLCSYLKNSFQTSNEQRLLLFSKEKNIKTTTGSIVTCFFCYEYQK